MNGDSIMDDHRAVIVCAHVALGYPILRAVRDEPEIAEDSGWQFLCDVAENEDPDDAKVWLVCEVLEKDPSIRTIINRSVGTIATKPHANSPWFIENPRKR
jgi:hypothetical protein